MQKLYRPNSYPPEVREKLRTMPPLAIEIANRWMLGWPTRAKGLLATGEYLLALIDQEDKERTTISAPGTNHLAHHEAAMEHARAMEPGEPSIAPEPQGWSIAPTLGHPHDVSEVAEQHLARL